MNDVRPPLHPSVAALRKAVRDAIAGTAPTASRDVAGADLLVALSGGADSL
ncbi:tRNA(Ile)-lysidine synthetase, partial [Plantibacter sp. CFBP 13570]|nr:tRNA(Ile)-lysidine synthetase [Plantibacter sp. CFBP 13570]